MIPRKIRKKLPKSRLISIEWGGYYDKPYFARFRCANFIRWQLYWVCITHRFPWHEGAARSIYPHLFKDQDA